MITITKTSSTTSLASSVTIVRGGDEIPLILSPSDVEAKLSTQLRIPYELFRPIISYVQDQRDLRNLAVASRYTQADAERFLHHTVSAKGVREVAERCRFLVRNPRLALLVRSISFRELPNKATWMRSTPLPRFYTLIKAALRSVPKLQHLDASILPSNALPLSCPFRLQSFTHDSLVIGLDAINFFAQQSCIKDLTLNPFSYYELHEDDEFYRRQLYNILPNLRSLSCGLSVAIRLVRGRCIERLTIPARPDCLESDQLERVIVAMCAYPHSILRQLHIERRFVDREGLRYVTKELTGLHSLSLVVSYASEWLQDLHTLTSLRTLSVVGDTYFDAHDPSLALDDLRSTCPELSTVYIRRSELAFSADKWIYRPATSEWVCTGEVDRRYTS